jgi:hypothetical protein
MSVLAVDDCHVTFCEYNRSVARIICVAVATLANKKLLERASDNDLLLCRKLTFQKMYGLRKVKLKIKWPGRLEKTQI